MKILELNFGKYEGKCMERLMLTDGGYIKWMLEEPNPTGPLKDALDHFYARIDQIDRSPWAANCFGPGCTSKAELMVVWNGTLAFQPYCCACSPYRKDKREPKLLEMEGYIDVLKYARSYSKNKVDWIAAIRSYMKHKGLTYNQRISDYDLVAYFGRLNALAEPALTIH